MPDLSTESMDDRLATVLRAITDDDHRRVAPPPGLWARIAADPRLAVNNVRPLRRRPIVVLAGALAVAASIVAFLVITLEPGRPDRVLASTALSNQGLASFAVTPSGHADLIDRHGQTYLRLSLRDAPSQPGTFLEVWLIDRNIHGMVALGPYAGDGAYLVPGAVHAGQYPVVDVSVQPANGVPTHSGVSVVRGTLPESTT